MSKIALDKLETGMKLAKPVQPQGSIIGHIGGDDFIFIMERTLVERAAKEIVDAFDRIIPGLYEAEGGERV